LQDELTKLQESKSKDDADELHLLQQEIVLLEKEKELLEEIASMLAEGKSPEEIQKLREKLM